MVKFLVIRLSSIGDIVLTTPVVRCVKEQVEGSVVHYLTRPAYAGILEANPHIDQIHHYENNTGPLIRKLKEEKYDYVIDLQNNIRSLQIKRSLKTMYFTLNKLNLKKWIIVNLKIDRLPRRHIVDRYLDTVKLFDVTNDNKGLDYFISPSDETCVGQLPEHFRNGYVVLAIGARHKTKKLPPGRLAELAGKIDEPLIIIGGPEDKPVADMILATHPEKVIFNGCGTWRIGQSAAIISRARVVITHDTGMMHIAAAFHRKIITIWGNTIPAFGMSAYQPAEGSVDFEVSGLRCRPCSKLGRESCPKKHFRCMEQQDLDRIAQTAGKLFLPTGPQTGK